MEPSNRFLTPPVGEIWAGEEGRHYGEIKSQQTRLPRSLPKPTHKELGNCKSLEELADTVLVELQFEKERRNLFPQVLS